MSKDISTGGPAFPFLTWQSPQGFRIGSVEPGMTLRDHFAGEVLSGIVSNPRAMRAIAGDLTQEDGEAALCRAAYRLADAMIAARGERS